VPELPEVETVARDLRGLLVGRTITHVTVRWDRTIAFPSVGELKGGIAGRQVVAVGRRGKYVVIDLDRGHLLIHLKMSGQLCVAPGDEPLDRHTHTVFDLDDGRQLRFRDVRKFGRVYLVDDAGRVTGGLGPEPLARGFRLEDLRRALARRSGRLKSLLLNQSFLAGIGNIYADEVLFAAKLHPLRRADSLTEEEQVRLYRAIRRVLKRAVEGRGTTLDDGGYVDAAGQAGTYREQLAVHERQGEPCVVCSTPIERIRIGGRSTYFCPNCQR
jgi:formamidopyrimidine-DNA glycosylase